MRRPRRLPAAAALAALLLFAAPSAAPGDAAHPAAPADLVQTGDVDGGADLAWSPPPGPVDGYIIFIDRTGRGEFHEFSRCREPRFRALGLSNGKSFGFRVAAFRGAHVSPMSGAVRVTPFDITPPDRPEGLTARPGRNEIALAWRRSTATDFLHYTVYRKPEGSRRYLPLEEDTGILEPAWTDRHVAPGTRYAYRVTATDRSGNESRRSERVETRTLSRPDLSFCLFDGKLHAYCRNPNDRTLFTTFAYEENLKRWAAWRRAAPELEPPPGVGDAAGGFSVSRTGRGALLYALFTGRGELHERRETGDGRFEPWRSVSTDRGALGGEPGRPLGRDVKVIGGRLHLANFDPVARTLEVRVAEDGRRFGAPRQFPARLPFLAGETAEIHLSLVAASPRSALLVAHVPGTRTLHRVETFADSTAPVDCREWTAEFPPPPNL